MKLCNGEQMLNADFSTCTPLADQGDLNAFEA